jgi:hypothetical protein
MLRNIVIACDRTNIVTRSAQPVHERHKETQLPQPVCLRHGTLVTVMVMNQGHQRTELGSHERNIR